jgi:hypothetical protein
MAKRRRKQHRKNSHVPSWLGPAIVVSGIASLWLWKKANPGASLNPFPPPGTSA